MYIHINLRLICQARAIHQCSSAIILFLVPDARTLLPPLPFLRNTDAILIYNTGSMEHRYNINL